MTASEAASSSDGRGDQRSPGPRPAAGDRVDVLGEVEEEAARLDRELDEIALLLQQARTEATRHVQRRDQAAARVSALQQAGPAVPPELKEALDLQTSMSRRAFVMEGQIDILEGKQRTLARFRDRMRRVAENLRAVDAHPGGQGSGDTTHGNGQGFFSAASARAVLSAQEDLRREIAREMHDGPAQSLTNIALQAQIVQRLMSRDPGQAEVEVGQLVGMVQRALEATKTFIFNVRPMVLDDLGLVPTLRRAARDRGQRAKVPIEFDSVGADRRLSEELESGLFRIIDDALLAYLATRPQRIDIGLDWRDDSVRATVRCRHEADGGERPSGDAREPGVRRDLEPDLPPALAAMIEEKRTIAAAVTAAADSARARARSLPDGVWTEIQERAATLGIDVALFDDGQTVVASASLAG